jgi:hypothetical protein
MFDDVFREQDKKNNSGTLTLGEALIGRYYRLLDGTHAGRVVIKSRDMIDGEEIIRFANGLTWCNLEKLKDVRCEQAYPSFNSPRHTVDWSQAQWYGDSGSGPHGHNW